jgi:predicted acyltransferase
MKGLLILLMLFVIDLYIPGLPPWLSETSSGSVGPGLAGWVFTGFLFMFGMTIPFAITNKINENLSSYGIIRHIFARTIVLLAVGILMVNTTRVNPELTGFGKDIWALMMFIAVFLVWNRYPEKDHNFFTVSGLKFLGLAVFVFLIFRFRSGSFENGGSLITGWWEIPGLAGWGLLVSGLTYLAFRNSIFGTFIIWLFFLSLNILTQLMLLEFLNPVRPYLGVLIDGHIPLILLSGHLAGLILKRFSTTEYKKVILILTSMSVIMIVSGFIFRKWIFTSEISRNPGNALFCCGLTLLIFTLVYWLADIRKNDRWFAFLKPAGEYAFMTYILPNIFYHLIWISGLPVLFYQNSGNIFINTAGSALWAIIMVWLTSVLVRLNIRLKI